MVMANGNDNCDGQRWWRRQWLMVRATAMVMTDSKATEMVAVMVDGDRNGNGQRQRRRQWAMATATATELVTAMKMATAIAMATATARVTMTKGGLPLHLPAMAVLWQGQHIVSTLMDTKECAFASAASWGWCCKECLLPFKGKGSWQLTMDWLFYFLQVLFSLLNNPLFVPCITQALKNPVSPLMLYLLHSYFIFLQR
jgi:hypothetical protein